MIRSRDLLCSSVLLLLACATPPPPADIPPPQYTLRAEQVVRLNLPGGKEFDASGLLLTPAGDLLTVNDRGATLYRIEFLTNRPEANLIPITNCFTRSQLAPFAAEKIGHYDCEGIAQDKEGRLYICEEANRWILRCDGKSGRVERLDIDWSPGDSYLRADTNGCLEVLAIGYGHLYCGNEDIAHDR